MGCRGRFVLPIQAALCTIAVHMSCRAGWIMVSARNTNAGTIAASACCSCAQMPAALIYAPLWQWWNPGRGVSRR